MTTQTELENAEQKVREQGDYVRQLKYERSTIGKLYIDSDLNSEQNKKEYEDKINQKNDEINLAIKKLTEVKLEATAIFQKNKK